MKCFNEKKFISITLSIPAQKEKKMKYLDVLQEERQKYMTRDALNKDVI